MSKPHPYSSVIPIAELDVFGVPPTQGSIQETIITEVRPLQPIVSENQTIEFEFSSGIDEYVMLRDMKFNFQLQVDLKKGTTDITVDDWKKCSITNNLLHSIFKNVEMTLNNKVLTLSPQNYAYKAYFENLLGYTNDSTYGLTTSWGFFQDQHLKESFSDTENISKILRPDTIDKNGKGKIIDLTGKLHLDLCMQPKALLGNSKINIKLTPNSKDFFLTCKSGVTISKINFLKASLFVPKLKVNQQVVDAHNISLSKGMNARYPITRGEVQHINLPTGQTDIIIPNHHNGQMPRRIFVGVVKNSSFNGKLDENPFNFGTNDLNYLTTYRDGVQCPSIPFTPDFSNNIFTREYLSLFEALNLFNTDSYLTIERSWYKKGNAIYGINYTADQCDDYLKGGYMDPRKIGTLGFHLKFKQASSTPLVLIVYSEYDNFIEIDINRNVFTDYN